MYSYSFHKYFVNVYKILLNLSFDKSLVETIRHSDPYGMRIITDEKFDPCILPKCLTDDFKNFSNLWCND